MSPGGGIHFTTTGEHDHVVAVLMFSRECLDSTFSQIQSIKLFLWIELIDYDRLDAFDIQAMSTEQVCDEDTLTVILG